MQKQLFLSFVRRSFKVVGLCLFLFSFHFSYSQNPLVKQWDYRYGGTYTEQLSSFQQTYDGGYILGGYTVSGISGNKTQACFGSSDFWIVKIDSLGKYE